MIRREVFIGKAYLLHPSMIRYILQVVSYTDIPQWPSCNEDRYAQDYHNIPEPLLSFDKCASSSAGTSGRTTKPKLGWE
jgi:hypothetical protein